MKKIKLKSKRVPSERLAKKDYIFVGIFWGIALLWCALFLLLMFWAITNSFRTNTEFILDPGGLPKKFNIKNYEIAITKIRVMVSVKGGGSRYAYFPEMIWNSILYAAVTPFFAVLTTAVAAYITAKFDEIGWVRIILPTMLVIFQLPLGQSLAASIKFLKDLSMFDSMIGMWIWSSGAFGGIYLLYHASFRGVSMTYAEAAAIDGASEFRIFFQIMLPMTKGIFLAFYLSKFVTIWNDYMSPMIYLPSYPTLSYAAWQAQYSVDTDFAMVPRQLAGLTIVLLPVIAVFVIFRDKLMHNDISVGGIKG